MDFETFDKYIWNHFLEIENELLNTTPYVAFDKANFKTFSEKYFILYQVIGSEIDVVAKLLCNELGNKTADKIDQYPKVILQHCPQIEQEEVYVYELKLDFMPWKDWSRQTPNWWHIYNKSKHERTTLSQNNEPWFNQCNLENLLNAFTGLYVLEMYLLKIILSKITNRDDFKTSIKRQKSVILKKLGKDPGILDDYDFDGVTINYNFN